MSVTLVKIKSVQRGASMIEVMVALLVLAVGLIGAMAMQVNGQQSNHRAQSVTEAYLLGGEMIERIFSYDDPDDLTDNDDYDGVDTATRANTPPGCIATGCNRAGQIEYDTWHWGDSLDSRLPGGRGMIAYNAATRVYTITVMWDALRAGVTGTGCSGDPRVDLTCYRVEIIL